MPSEADVVTAMLAELPPKADATALIWAALDLQAYIPPGIYHCVGQGKILWEEPDDAK